MTNDGAKQFFDQLSPDDKRRLQWLLSVVGRIEGWCDVNRWLGKVLIASIIGFLILTSQAWDAIRNLLGWKH